MTDIKLPNKRDQLKLNFETKKLTLEDPAKKSEADRKKYET
jgi:hypothetical protein